ncbi:MAG: YiaA/YiaB family inner membrane protein [Bacteroidota bacterium]
MAHSIIDHSNSKSYYSMAWIAFVLAIGGTLAGIVLLPATVAIKGFLAMGFVFTVSSCFTLAKVVRDRHEAERLYNKVERAKTEKFLSEAENPNSIL